MTELRPSILYKYRDSSEWTDGIFKDKAVWLSIAAKLNDPLECKTGVIPDDWMRRTIRGMEEAQIMGVIARPPDFQPPTSLFSLTPRETRQWIKRLKSKTHAERVKSIRKLYGAHGVDLSKPSNLFKVLDEQLASIGIFSLSSEPDNELMWSHYAAGHTGLALGFACEEGSKLADARHTIPVTYSNTKPVFTTGFMQEVQFFVGADGRQTSKARFSFNDPVFRSALSTKPAIWNYESEWRYIEEKGGAYSWPGPLKHVVFGCKMAEVDRRKYRTLAIDATGGDVEFFEMAIPTGSSEYILRKLPI